MNSLRDLPSIENLVAALEAAQLGSFSAAADELGVTHAAISRRIAAVEEWAGTRLFERHGRGVDVTVAGQRILSRIGVALDQVAALPSRLDRRVGLPSVRIAVTPSFARFWLLPRLDRLEGRPLSVQIEVVADLRHSDLVGGEVDLAIRYGRGGWHEGLETKLFEETLMPVVSPGVLKDAMHANAATLLQLPLLHSGDRTNWLAWCSAHGVEPRPQGRERLFPDYGLAIDAASFGLGLALWNRSLHDLNPGMVALEQFPVESPLSYYLLARAGDRGSPAMLIAERILNECSAAPA